MIVLTVALAGGIGAVLRFVVDGVVARSHRWSLPLGTVVINVTGSFLLGLVTGLALADPGLADMRTVVGTGVLGGYTTFSTASVEAVNIALTDGRRATLVAAGHATGMLVLSLAAGALGWWLA